MIRWKRNLYILVVCQFFVMGAMTMIIPFLPLYLQELGVTEAKDVSMWTGIIVGANFLTAFLFSPFWGRLADWRGRKLMILRSGFGMALVVSLTGFATGPVSLLLLRLLNGVVSGFIPASIGLVSTNTPKERVGYALGVLQAGAVSGGICGPLFGGLLADLMGFRSIFYVTGALILVAGIVVLFFVHEKFTPTNQQVKTSTLADFKKIIHHAPILSLCMITFLLQLALMGINPLVPIFVQELAPQANIAFYAGLTVATMGVANMLTAPVLGKLSDKKGADRVLFFASLGVAIFSIPQAFVVELWQLILLRFFTGLCLGGLLPAVNTLIRLHAPVGMESRTYSFSNSAMYLGNMLGPILGGAAVGLIGIRGIFLLAIIPLVISLILTRFKVTPIERSARRQMKEQLVLRE